MIIFYFLIFKVTVNVGAKWSWSENSYFIKISVEEWIVVVNGLSSQNYTTVSSKLDQDDNLEVLLKTEGRFSYVLLTQGRSFYGFDPNDVTNIMVDGEWTSKNGGTILFPNLHKKDNITYNSDSGTVPKVG